MIIWFCTQNAITFDLPQELESLLLSAIGSTSLNTSADTSGHTEHAKSRFPTQ